MLGISPDVLTHFGGDKMGKITVSQRTERRKGATEWLNVLTIHRNIVKVEDGKKTFTPDSKIDETTNMPRHELCAMIEQTATRLNLDVAVLTKSILVELGKELDRWKSKKVPSIIISLE